jgi:hypothetical protein
MTHAVLCRLARNTICSLPLLAATASPDHAQALPCWVTTAFSNSHCACLIPCACALLRFPLLITYLKLVLLVLRMGPMLLL